MGRSGDHAKDFLKDWKGIYLHCNGYGGYKKLKDVTLCGCLVHTKHKFHEAYIAGQSNENAKIGENYLKKLFAIEKIAIANNLKPEHYLTYVYEQIQLQKDLKLENLLPWSKMIPEECKNKTSD
jgi:hypothetical protein